MLPTWTLYWMKKNTLQLLDYCVTGCNFQSLLPFPGHSHHNIVTKSNINRPLCANTNVLTIQPVTVFKHSFALMLNILLVRDLVYLIIHWWMMYCCISFLSAMFAWRNYFHYYYYYSPCFKFILYLSHLSCICIWLLLCIIIISLLLLPLLLYFQYRFHFNHNSSLSTAVLAALSAYHVHYRQLYAQLQLHVHTHACTQCM